MRDLIRTIQQAEKCDLEVTDRITVEVSWSAEIDAIESRTSCDGRCIGKSNFMASGRRAKRKTHQVIAVLHLPSALFAATQKNGSSISSPDPLSVFRLGRGQPLADHSALRR